MGFCSSRPFDLLLGPSKIFSLLLFPVNILCLLQYHCDYIMYCPKKTFDCSTAVWQLWLDKNLNQDWPRNPKTLHCLPCSRSSTNAPLPVWGHFPNAPDQNEFLPLPYLPQEFAYVCNCTDSQFSHMLLWILCQIKGSLRVRNCLIHL